MAVPTQEAMRIILPFDPDDQTFGYLPDGEPITADWQSTVWPIPNMLKPGAVMAHVECHGKVRNRRMGDPEWDITQPRRAEIVIGIHDTQGDIFMHSVKRSQFPEAPMKQPITAIPEIIGFSAEERRATTALKKRHTRAHWPITESKDRLGGVRKLGLGGHYSTVTRAMYKHQRTLIELQEQQQNTPRPPPTDDIPF